MALAASRNVFKDCNKLMGGKGTAYDPAHVDADYAHIDGGPDNAGYLTDIADLRGDVTGDGEIDINDVTALINYVLNGDASSINLAVANCNLDNTVDINDVTALINFLLKGAWD